MADECVVPVISSASGCSGWLKELKVLGLAREREESSIPNTGRSSARRNELTVICPTPTSLPLQIQLQSSPGKQSVSNLSESECPNGNMRLFDVDVSRDYIIGSYNKYEVNSDKPPRSVMNGGEKSPKKSPSNLGMDRHKTARIVQAVKKEEKDEDYESDSSEELQYGPGIVNKLKTKYLSLTLRENQKRGVRPSLANLRRSTSLENILDDDPTPAPPKTQYFKKNFHPSSRNSNKVSQYCAKYMNINQNGRESIKRAQSVDAIYRNEPKCTVVIAKSNTVESRMSHGSDVIIMENSTLEVSPPKSTTEVAKELPPPDLVKQTLKIFETRTNDSRTVLKQKIKVPNKPLPEKKVGVKPVVFPKPVLSGDKINVKPRSPVKRHANPVESKPPPGKPKSEYFVRLKSPPTSPVLNSENHIEKKFISSKALENIEKEGSMIKYSFSDSLASAKAYLPKVNQAPNNVVLNNSIERSPPKPDTHVVTSPVKQVAVIRPVVTNKVPLQNKLTNVEIEKNRLNKVKSVDSAIVQVDNKSVECDHNESNSNKSEKVTLWGDPKNRQQNQNTMVFNFVNTKKEIPDYIENDGLVFTTKRDRSKCNGEEESDEDSPDSAGLCAVNVIGGNVVINGKSNLRKQPKQHKVNLRIQFNDAATTLFEYPREDSTGDDVNTPTPTSPTSPNTIIPTGSSLSTYTPCKLGMVEGAWELGVTRVSPVTSPTQPPVTKVSQPPCLEDYLKPVDSQDVTPWSQETTADILF